MEILPLNNSKEKRKTHQEKLERPRKNTEHLYVLIFSNIFLYVPIYSILFLDVLIYSYMFLTFSLYFPILFLHVLICSDIFVFSYIFLKPLLSAMKSVFDGIFSELVLQASRTFVNLS